MPHRRTIVRQADRLANLVLDAQRRIFRLAERDHDLTLKAISLDSGIPYDTLRSYAARDPAMMPVSALLKLIDVVPDYLLSQMLDPVNRRLEIVSNENGDIDELGREAAGFVAEYVDAKSDGKITPIDRARLTDRAARLGDTAQQVASA